MIYFGFQKRQLPVLIGCIAVAVLIICYYITYIPQPLNGTVKTIIKDSEDGADESDNVNNGRVKEREKMLQEKNRVNRDNTEAGNKVKDKIDNNQKEIDQDEVLVKEVRDKIDNNKEENDKDKDLVKDQNINVIKDGANKKPKHVLSTVDGALSPQGVAIDRTKNGTWFSMGQTREIYVYSAFFDDREAIVNGPVIRLIAVTDKSIQERSIYCQLKYPGSSETEIQLIEPTDIGAGIYRHGVYFREYVLVCPMKNKEKIPTAIGITEDKNKNSSIWLHVEKPVHPKLKMDFCSCVSATYWFHEPYKIVEWMELHKLFGVSMVTIYNNSLDARSSRVFQHYANEGFVDFRHSYSFVPDPGELTIHMHMSPVINDCILRNMHKCNKIVVTDLDEMVVPRNHLTYKDLIQEIDKAQWDSHPARSYTFRNSYFFLNIPGDEEQPEKLVTLRHRKRMPASPPGYSVKSIIDPQACTNMHNHFCWRRASKLDISGHSVYVEPGVALNQHYKKCHFDSYHGKVGECAQMYEKASQDDIMLKYRDALIKGVSEQLKKLGMNPLTNTV